MQQVEIDFLKQENEQLHARLRQLEASSDISTAQMKKE